MRKRSLAFRSLLAVSLLSIVYISLFFGSTLAWFVDSTGVTVNTFTMGTLDAKVYTLEYDSSVDTYKAGSERQVTSNTMLEFYQRFGSSDSQYLFEPGATFALPVLYVKNFSSFPINYKIRILKPTTPTETSWTDRAGNTYKYDSEYDLYDVLEFYAEDENGTKIDLSKYQGSIKAASDLTAGVESEKITIFVHMKETAGNEYMNKLVSGIQVQFYLYQSEATGEGDAWYIEPDAGYKIIDTVGGEDMH